MDIFHKAIPTCYDCDLQGMPLLVFRLNMSENSEIDLNTQVEHRLEIDLYLPIVLAKKEERTR